MTAKDEDPTDLNTVVFNLMARCERRKDIKKGETRADSIWTGAEGTLVPLLPATSTHSDVRISVKSSQIEFDAKGAQAELLGAACAANGDILLAKMRGGQVRLPFRAWVGSFLI